MLFFLSTFNPPSFFFALICWQHWNEKYLSLQQNKKSTSTLWDIGTQGVWEIDHLRSTSFAVDGTFDRVHYYPSLETHLCCKQNTLRPAGSSRLILCLTTPTHFMSDSTGQKVMCTVCILVYLLHICICTSRQTFYTQCYPISPEHKCFLLHLSQDHSGRTGWDSTHSTSIVDPYLCVSLSQLFALLGPWVGYKKSVFTKWYLVKFNLFSFVLGWKEVTVNQRRLHNEGFHV